MFPLYIEAFPPSGYRTHNEGSSTTLEVARQSAKACDTLSLRPYALQ